MVAALLDVVNGLDAEERILVRMHARAGTCPDAMVGVVSRPVMVERGNGKPKMEYRNRRPVMSYVRYPPNPESIKFSRWQYRAWWRALVRIRQSVDSRVGNVELIGPAARRMPWK